MVLLLGGCGGLLQSDGAPSSIWWLEPLAAPAAPSKSATARPIGLQVSVVPGLDTDRVLTLDTRAQLSRLAGAHWAEFLPELLFSLVSRSLEEAGWEAGAAHGLHEEDCLLHLEARRFWIRLDAQDQARSAEVSLAGQLRCGNQAAAPIEASASIPIPVHRMPEIVAATQQALDQTLTDLLAQLARAPIPIMPNPGPNPGPQPGSPAVSQTKS
jgi:ABC-type uncharacterized transport system auxiliary subunit